MRIIIPDTGKGFWSMSEIKSKNHRIIKFTAVMVISAAWLAFQIWLWNNQLNYQSVTRRFCEAFPQFGINKSSEWKRFCSVACYLSTLLPVLFGYYIMMMRPRLSSENPYWNKKRILVAAAILIPITVFSLFSVPGIYRRLIPGWSITGSAAGKMYVVIAAINAVLCVVGTVLVVCLAYITPIIKRKSFKLPAIRKSVVRYALCILLGLLSAVGYVMILNIFGVFNEDAKTYVLRSFTIDPNLVSGVITMSVMAPFIEELAFRGLIFANMKKFAPVWVAVVISSVFFGLWHRNLGQFCYTVFAGVLFAGVFQKTNRLRFAMLIHCTDNSINNLCLASGNGVLPYIPFLYKIKNLLLALSLPLSIVLLMLVLALIIVIVWKLLPGDDNA